MFRDHRRGRWTGDGQASQQPSLRRRTTLFGQASPSIERRTTPPSWRCPDPVVRPTGMVLPSSRARRTTPPLNLSENCRRARRPSVSFRLRDSASTFGRCPPKRIKRMVSCGVFAITRGGRPRFSRASSHGFAGPSVDGHPVDSRTPVLLAFEVVLPPCHRGPGWRRRLADGTWSVSGWLR